MRGDAARAEEVIRPAVEALERMGERALLASAAPLLAEALYEQGRIDEAVDATVLAERVSDPDDVAAQAAWRGARSKALAARGDHRQAERLAREGVARIADSEFLQFAGDAYADLGTVLSVIGKADAARDAYAKAKELYERKGNVVSVRRTEAELAELRPDVSGRR
jgi:tetratricopeptide (TPR) repeat protein